MYGDYFKVYRYCNKVQSYQCLSGLFHEGKHNIEQMTERVESSTYQGLHHFISESPWDHRPIISQVGKDISALFSATPIPVGLILDESGHRKSGKGLVGRAVKF